MTSYDKTANFTSNSLSSYFNDIGFRERLDEDILHDWFGAPNGFSLGGNYGESTPSDLSFVLDGCQIDKDAPATTYENSISALAAAEMLRRIVLHRSTPMRDFQELHGMIFSKSCTVLASNPYSFRGKAGAG